MAADHKSGLYSSTFQDFHFEMRLDVDGDFAQNQVSVALTNQFPSHWIASLATQSAERWVGQIWYRHGAAETVTIGGITPNRFIVLWEETDDGDEVSLTFAHDFQSLLTITFEKQSESFRTVEFEIDNEAGVDVLTEYDTHDHPRRPTDLPQETLTLAETFSRTGVEVSMTAGANELSDDGAGFDEEWNVTELHDAMLANWSRSDGTPWSMWIFAASQFDNEPGFVTFGIMFDFFGSFHRNGTAVFNTAIEDFYPPGTPNRQATIRRHKFRTLVHEIGHAFNLAHSWDKDDGTPWHPGVFDEPEARSYMNYPNRVDGEDNAYWDTFRFRFSDQELEFLRHAPANFVSMGRESWFENHSDLAVSRKAGNDLQLELRFQRARPIFDFMEPVYLELKLTNRSRKAVQVAPETLHDVSRMNVYVTRKGGATKKLRPFSTSCFAPMRQETLKYGQSMYGELLLSVASNGWLISEPGEYNVVVTLAASCSCDKRQEELLASGSTTLYVRPPAIAERIAQERIAQDYFGDDVGRVLAFGGSRTLTTANDVLHDVSDRFGDAAASIHAKLAIGLPDARKYKHVIADNYGKLSVSVSEPNIDTVRALTKDVLIDSGLQCAETLGHLAFKRVSDGLSTAMEKVKDTKAAAGYQRNILKVMRARKAKLPKSVRDAIKARVSSLTGK